MIPASLPVRLRLLRTKAHSAARSALMSRATADTAPAIVFLVLYTAVLLVLGYLYATKAVRWKSRYSFLLFHVVMRVVGMALGVAFSCLTWQNGHRVGGEVD